MNKRIIIAILFSTPKIFDSKRKYLQSFFMQECQPIFKRSTDS